MMRAAKMMDHGMDNDETRNSKLQELKQQNADRWAKLQLLHSQHSNGPVDLSATLAQEIKQVATVVDPKLDADPRAFLREVVETHDELVQTRAVLEQRLEHDKSRIGVMKQILQQNHELKANLETRKEASNPTSTRTPVNNLEEESNWLMRDFIYIMHSLDEDSTPGLWSLNKLVQELMQRYLTSPSDPYLLASSLPIHPNHIALLNKYYVIQSHEHNPDLICLTDYLEGTKRNTVVSFE